MFKVELKNDELIEDVLNRSMKVKIFCTMEQYHTANNAPSVPLPNYVKLAIKATLGKTYW